MSALPRQRLRLALSVPSQSHYTLPILLPLLLPLLLLVNHQVLAGPSAATHDWDHAAHRYYAVDLLDMDMSPNEAFSTLGLHYLGPAGDIHGYHFVSLPRDLEERRENTFGLDQVARAGDTNNDPDPLTEYLEHLRTHMYGPLHPDQHRILQAIQQVEPQKPRRHLVSRSAIPAPPFPPPGERRPTMADTLNIHDPGFYRQWHLHNAAEPGKDINVTGVWAQNITGKGVIVTIIDDGLDYDSADLKGNFYAEGSYDFNDHQALPQPKLADDLHGTRCAGEIAAMRNDVCGVGVAYDAKVAGVRILSGALTDADEALALNYGYQESSIYSCSWGPPDDGSAVDAPNGIVRRAMLTGIEKGRGGKGTLFVFASGNGGALEDNCNFDGYTNSVYTITIGAVDRHGQHPFYAEVCSGQLAVSYSSGSGGYIVSGVALGKGGDRRGISIG